MNQLRWLYLASYLLGFLISVTKLVVSLMISGVFLSNYMRNIRAYIIDITHLFSSLIRMETHTVKLPAYRFCADVNAGGGLELCRY